MLAYSSVEHMGILALGVGIGGAGLFGALLHVVYNALTKGVLFLSAGNIHRAYGSKSVDEVTGVLTRLPLSGGLFLAGFFAITGSPPFAPFVSEFTILNAAFTEGHTGAGVLFLVLMLVVFVGMGATVLPLVQGRPSAAAQRTSIRETLWTGAPVVVLMGLVLLLGLWLPAPLRGLVDEAVHYMEVGP
jgi:hydrogenase-4 component F